MLYYYLDRTVCSTRWCRWSMKCGTTEGALSKLTVGSCPVSDLTNRAGNWLPGWVWSGCPGPVAPAVNRLKRRITPQMGNQWIRHQNHRIDATISRKRTGQSQRSYEVWTGCLSKVILVLFLDKMFQIVSKCTTSHTTHKRNPHSNTVTVPDTRFRSC